MEITEEKLESLIQTLTIINNNLDYNLCRLNEVMDSIRTNNFHVELWLEELGKLVKQAEEGPS